jgi:hypothetical protein
MGRRLKARLTGQGHGGESGLTIIEVLVAAVVLVLGAAATFGILGAATRNAQRAKATQVSLDLAQEELERLHGLPYESLAVDTQPQTASDALNPGYRVKGNEFALRRNPVGEYGDLVIDEAKGVSPESDFYNGDTEHGGIKGTLYRYVVWRNDPSCPETQCPGEEDYKQIVIAVQPDRAVNQQGESGYVEVQSKATNPEPPEESAAEKEAREKEEKEKEEKEAGEDVTAQQFFLSDTPCAQSGATTRQEISADHLLHNTLGICASGPQTGGTVGAPDALLRNSPPDPYPEDESKPSLFDYSDDAYLEPTPDTDKGVQILRDDTSGCHYNPTGVTYPQAQVHRWVTDPMPVGGFEVGGTVTLEFYTRTLNDALYTGRLCVYLFERTAAGAPPGEENDTILISALDGNPYWTYEPQGNGYWPRNAWTRVRLTMEIAGGSHTIPADDRLGVALSVDRADTPADAIPIMYDHPNYPTRIEVDTSTPLEGEGG